MEAIAVAGPACFVRIGLTNEVGLTSLILKWILEEHILNILILGAYSRQNLSRKEVFRWSCE